MAVLTVLAVSAVSVVTATPLKTQPPFSVILKNEFLDAENQKESHTHVKISKEPQRYQKQSL